MRFSNQSQEANGPTSKSFNVIRKSLLWRIAFLLNHRMKHLLIPFLLLTACIDLSCNLERHLQW